MAWVIEEAFNRSGAEHMARDEELARTLVSVPLGTYTLRIYSWQPQALSIGYQQSMDVVNQRACEMHGVDVVRRPTGGRAVLHANELTYAVIMRSDGGIYRTHNVIVESLLRSFEVLGASLDLTTRSSDTNFRTTYSAGTLTNAACFASSARHEATHKGRKVIGSAQRRFGDVVLQHGSILLTNDHLLLQELLNVTDVERSQMRSLLERETASLSQVCGRTISIEEAAAALRERFVPEICELLACQPEKALP